MKRHSGWLAAGLLLFAVLACNLSKNNNNGNNSNRANANSNKNSNTVTSSRPANADVYIKTTSMAKDNNGKAGETTTTFAPDDHTIHVVADLNKAKGGTKVRFVWKAVDAGGSTNREIKTIDYTTKSFENKLHGQLSKATDWPKGSYAVEIYINDALDKTIEYTVE
jgi:hypothetical protein